MKSIHVHKAVNDAERPSSVFDQTSTGVAGTAPSGLGALIEKSPQILNPMAEWPWKTQGATVNPAALSALASGDMDNFRTASTPGGIEAQEKAGQTSLVASGGRLPKEIMNRGITREQITSATGIVFGVDIDDLFVTVTFPPGWKLKATEHSMHSDLLDASGCARGGVFYKAAFYERRAHIHFTPRYRVNNDYEKPSSTVSVIDNVTGKPIYSSDTFAYEDFAASRAAESAAETWLTEKHPDHRDPFAYWAA